MSRNLLICFDAFGTLFMPKRPIAQQYGEVARSLFGLGGFTDEQLADSFKKAFKQQAKQHPNFGKANGMNPERWWTNIIHNTFRPLVGAEQRIHEDLAPKLLHRFGSEEGYDLMPGVRLLLQGLKDRSANRQAHTVVGVVTNSDNRVPGILSSFGLSVSPLRYGDKPLGRNSVATRYDIDFTVMSYDAGHEKPDKRIFAAAEEMLQLLPVATETDLNSWDLLHVGDEYEKDVVGAKNARWYAVLVNGEAGRVPRDVADLSQADPNDLLQHMRDGHPYVALSSLELLAQWLGIRP
ncbi:hypothetical protein LTR08_001321 [Meristemomyces frigidus]|nr:hypothetical protein LTR08_001321 [Meristemomyces frigidus]